MGNVIYSRDKVRHNIDHQIKWAAWRKYFQANSEDLTKAMCDAWHLIYSAHKKLGDVLRECNASKNGPRLELYDLERMVREYQTTVAKMEQEQKLSGLLTPNRY